MTQVKCDNCEWSGDINECEPYRDFWSRVDVGGEVPAGDCPKCGAFAYLVKPSTVPPADLLEALEGLCAVVGKMKPASGEPYGRAVAELIEARVVIAKARSQS